MGCSKPEQGPVTEAAAVVPLTPELRQAALEQGKAIAAEAFGLLSTNLQSAIRQGGVSNALPFCSIAALPLTESVTKTRGISLRRVSHKPRNPKNQAGPEEMAVLKQFELGLQHAKAVPPVVTNMLPGQVTFMAPISIQNPLCLNCHGKPGTDIALPNVDLIKSLYPQDKATGFAMGELRGAWRIDFPIAALEGTRASQP